MFTLQGIIAWIIQYKYAVMLPIAVVEGPIVTVLGGFLSAHGILNAYIVYGVSLLGDIIGDLLYYALGRWGRETFLMKWASFVGVTKERIKKLELHFEQHSGKTLILGKISHGIGSVVLIAAGASKMPVGKFVWYNLVSSLPKSLAFILIGYYFGEAYKRISAYIDYTALGTFVVAVLIALIYYLVVKIARKESGEE